MARYVYWCTECGEKFELSSPMPGQSVEICQCGYKAQRIPSSFNFGFGWRLTEDSHIPNPNPYAGRKHDKFERDV